MNDALVERMCTLARKNLVYLSWGEWSGSPEKIEDLSLEFLIEMQLLCEKVIKEKTK